MELDWQEHEDGSITVLDLPVMATMRKGEKDIASDIGPAELQKYADNANDRQKRLNAPPLPLLGHNQLNKQGQVVKAAPIIGSAADTRFDSDTKLLRIGKVRITNPEQVAKIKRGEQNIISAEFFEKRKLLWGFSFLDGAPNHQLDSLPRFTLKAKPVSTTAPANSVAVAAQADIAEFQSFTTSEPLFQAALGPTGDAMPTLEEIKQLLQGELKPINDRLAKLEADDEPAKPKGDDDLVDKDVQAEAARQLKKEREGLEQLKKSTEIDSFVTQLSAKNGGATERQQKFWREKLEACGNDGNWRKERFNALMREVGRGTEVTLDSEDDVMVLGNEALTREEYKQLKADNPLMGNISEDHYAALARKIG